MPTTLEEVAKLIKSNKLDQAASELANVNADADEKRADKLCLEGLVCERKNLWQEAIAKYRAALELDDDHSQSLFRLACLLDLHGEDEEAMKAYERCIHDPPTHVNALLNLAVLYDDHGRYEEALELVESVAEQFPNHVKARIFYRDIESSLTMHYDEDRERVREKHDAILDVPISDFELSVRSRNCLKQMNIHTIGDLLRVTEQKLLAYKNFGETSLNEIKAMLSQNGLRLGQALEDGGVTVGRPAPAVVSGDPNLLNRSVAELELSVRSRKCLQRLGVSSIGELTQKSEPELLSAKNFGQTSLLEIKRRLTEMGLALRGAAQ